jgi:hypothetical protein
MPKESDYARIVNCLDTAVCIAIESHAVYSATDLTTLVHSLWNERSTENGNSHES